MTINVGDYFRTKQGVVCVVERKIDRDIFYLRFPCDNSAGAFNTDSVMGWHKMNDLEVAEVMLTGRFAPEREVWYDV